MKKETRTNEKMRSAAVRISLLAALFGICSVSTTAAQDQDPQTRIGIISPLVVGDDSTLQDSAVAMIKSKLHAIGGYDVYTEKRLKDAAEVFGKDYPEYCREPRCAAALGTMLNLDRMLYGRVIQNPDRFAVELTMVDVASHRIVNEASIEGDPGVPLKKVIDGALNRIHEVEDTLLSQSMNRYFGEEVNHLLPMAISSGAYIGGALAYALIGNDRQETKVDYDDPLSGIPAEARSAPKSARASGMGNCYVALAKDAYGVYFNPAGASWVDGVQGSVSYRNHFGVVNSMSGSFAANATRELGWGHSFQYTGSPESYYQELEFGTVVSYKFNELFGKLPPFSVGAGLNISSVKTTGGSGSKYDQEGTGFGMGLDLGILAELSQRIDLGVVFTNVPNFMSYSNKTQGTRYYEPRPATCKVGATYEVGYATLLTAEGTLPLYDDQVFRLAGGLEQRLFGIMLMRLGAEKQTLQSYDSPWHLTAGLGFDIPVRDKKIAIDGSYDFNTSRELFGVWDCSMKMSF